MPRPRFDTCLLLAALSAVALRPGVGLAQVPPVSEPVVRVGHLPRQPYTRYSVADPLGRRITFFLSEDPDSVRTKPLVVFAQGSGPGSLFARTGTGFAGRYGHPSLYDAVAGRARILLVEKPGVEVLSQPASVDAASEEFRREHTLERWCTAIAAAMRAARTLPGVDRRRALVIGHSEGGIVAARLAGLDSGVTAVALLAGGGPSQLYDLQVLGRQGVFFADRSSDPEARVAYVRACWDSIRLDPASTTRYWLGHPYRRWFSFLSHSTLYELERSRARVFVAQGTADRAVAPETAEMLAAELTARGREVSLLRVEGADHDFLVVHADGRREDLWADTLRRAVNWAFPP